MSTVDTILFELLHRPNRLKKKVSGSETGAPGIFTAELLARALAAAAEHAARYPIQAEIDLQNLSDLRNRLVTGAADRSASLHLLQLGAREIMGQAETFDFPLLTRFGRSLYDFCEGLDAVSAPQRIVIDAHIDAMRVVVRDRIHGDGGEIGRDLATSLEAAKRKLCAPY